MHLVLGVTAHIVDALSVLSANVFALSETNSSITRQVVDPDQKEFTS